MNRKDFVCDKIFRQWPEKACFETNFSQRKFFSFSFQSNCPLLFHPEMVFLTITNKGKQIAIVEIQVMLPKIESIR